MDAEVDSSSPKEIIDALSGFVEEAVRRAGGSTQALRPNHRVKFVWPPHPVSYEYHVLASDWTGKTTFTSHGETFRVQVATTPYGIFGKCEDLWLEVRGDSIELMLKRLGEASEPLFKRQLKISSTLGLPSRFTGTCSELRPIQLLKLLYCSDRDVANDARIEIETHASSRNFFPGLLYILKDRRHPQRRSAQWCVLDLFEDLSSYVTDDTETYAAMKAMRDLIWDAEDDYARTIYKAGVVLGGHLPHLSGGEVLMECVGAPSKYGRRSAIHGLFHVVEWLPDTREEVVETLRAHAKVESEPLLAEFASSMAKDIENMDHDHVPEPVFAEER